MKVAKKNQESQKAIITRKEFYNYCMHASDSVVSGHYIWIYLQGVEKKKGTDLFYYFCDFVHHRLVVSVFHEVVNFKERLFDWLNHCVSHCGLVVARVFR